MPSDATPYGGHAVIGGYVYHGPGGGQGLYFLADDIDSHVWTTRIADGAAQDFINRDTYIQRDSPITIGSPTSFAVDGSGRLYVLDFRGDLFAWTPSWWPPATATTICSATPDRIRSMVAAATTRRRAAPTTTTR